MGDTQLHGEQRMVSMRAGGWGEKRRTEGGTQSLPRLLAQQALGCSPHQGHVWVIAWGGGPPDVKSGMSSTTQGSWHQVPAFQLRASQRKCIFRRPCPTAGASTIMVTEPHTSAPLCFIQLCSHIWFCLEPMTFTHFSYSILPPNLHQGPQPACPILAALT